MFILSFIIFVVFLATLLYKNFIKKNNSNQTNNYKSLLSDLKNLKKIILEDSNLNVYYYDDIELLLEEINSKISSIINKQATDNDISNFIFEKKEVIKNMKKDYLEQENNKNSLIVRAQSFLEEFKEYINLHSFYPTQFLFSAHQVEAKIQDLKDSKPKNLRENIEDLSIKLEEFSNEFQMFLEMKNDIKTFLENTHAENGNDKQNLLFYVQQSNFDEAKKILKKEVI